ncbi:hypothetical protein C8F04DRAFT_1274219 [Mycena alexandri]|uniref:Uncharacterized protein n=1 Tax=Mycena alexandri TaxID=1745969 RepID=A0AAD6S4I1_9AGAR|nr:hypothetical protein C8F04DRAFT_1274219 [Mycena alexandri]
MANGAGKPHREPPHPLRRRIQPLGEHRRPLRSHVRLSQLLHRRAEGPDSDTESLDASDSEDDECGDTASAPVQPAAATAQSTASAPVQPAAATAQPTAIRPSTFIRVAPLAHPPGTRLPNGLMPGSVIRVPCTAPQLPQKKAIARQVAPFRRRRPSPAKWRRKAGLDEPVSRRGCHHAKHVGVAMGGGQRYPQNLAHAAHNLLIFAGLFGLKSLQRIAGWTNMLFNGFTPTGIFRWVYNDFRTDKDINTAKFTTSAERERWKQDRARRWQDGIRMYRRWDGPVQ